MDKTVFISLPVEELQSLIIDCVNSCLKYSQCSSKYPQVPTDQIFTVDQAADFLSLSKATIYAKASNGTIPYFKDGKRLYFSRAELMEHLRSKRRKTRAEIEEEASQYLKKKRGGAK